MCFLKNNRLLNLYIFPSTKLQYQSKLTSPRIHVSFIPNLLNPSITILPPEAYYPSKVQKSQPATQLNVRTDVH
ncbi:hypothetical protein BO82DRAFT_77293 [Aspergillus uvarum CBS 121591]|uniref:Uncharacterized protein n=1 Tax=Aspergillus uvarum CBS 121591 TaxID=1448315 RepID=A0A319CE68_9EURO|nr:hypothetical protein BO82DRAFT_77293 [Aspergillus uvarum CBS 121591]PYH81657.1 hypothetical protein BO82DRAFT_77293 [Aspergillus uvarum CBS 121591]